MDGIHDLGGMHGFGPVEVEPDEPVFHTRWEGRVAALFGLLLLRGYVNLDAFRHGIETLPAADYLRASYFERWRRSVEKNLVGAGVLEAAELEGRRDALRDGTSPPKPRRTAAPPPPLRPGFEREIEAAPRFRAGEVVRASNMHPAGHTRLPRYLRGRCGRVTRVHAAFVFPDSHAHGLGERPQHLYNVRFEGGEVWGDAAEPRTAVCADLFESYLEAADRA